MKKALTKSFVVLNLFLTLLIQVSVAQAPIRGRIVEAKTKLPIPFATVVYSANQLQKGVITDVHGRFEIVDIGVSSITASCMGFVSRSVDVNSKAYTTSGITIALEEKAYELEGVVVTPKENPAHPIVRAVLRNKNLNNHSKYESYTYSCYFKTIIDLVIPDDDSLSLVLKDAIKDQAGFISEMVVKVTGKAGREESKIVAQRTSGLQSPIMAQVFYSFFHNSISFYNNSIPLFQLPLYNDRALTEYVSPLASGCFGMYNYHLENTYHEATDTVFMISFYPKRGSTFNGLKGTLFISSNNYAIRSIVVEPFEPGLLKFRFKQEYTFVDGKWFPYQLDEEIGFETPLQMRGKTTAYPAYIIRSAIDSIKFQAGQTRNRMGLESVYLDEKSLESSGPIIEQSRRDLLTLRELNAYLLMDSIGRKINFDRWLNLVPKLAEGKLPFRLVDLDLSKLYVSNEFEGSRFGLGLFSNSRLSRHFILGGSYGYGTRDEEQKYGGSFELNLSKYYELKLGYVFQNDLREVGEKLFTRLAIEMEVNDYLRKYLSYRFERLEEHRVQLGLRASRHLTLSTSLSVRDFTLLYPYAYKGAELTRYQSDEIQVLARFSYNEKLSTLGDIRYVNQIGNPAINLIYQRGIDFINAGSPVFNRIEASLQLMAYNGRIGQSDLLVKAGYIDRSLPYGLLFTGEGSSAGSLSFLIRGSFQTMKPYEFLSDRYAHLFYTHNFGSLFFQAKKFKPQFLVGHGLGWSNLKNSSDHEIEFDTLNRVYNESGLIINNIVRFKYANMFYVGFGAGAFYRWGAYAFDEPKDNLAIKFSVAITLK